MAINWELFKCRCSAISKMMSNKKGAEPLTEKQRERRSELENKINPTVKQLEELLALQIKDEKSKELVLSDTCIEYLMETYAWETKGIFSVTKEMDILQLEKGKLAEEEAITLISIVDGQLYAKNDERIFNDFLSGIPDIFRGEHIMAAEEVIDAKSSFDYPIFLKKLNQGLENGHEDQVAGYMDITGAKKGWVAHCLPNMPKSMMDDYKRKLLFKMDVISEESPEFKKKWAQFERSMVFDDIPPHQKVYKIPVEPFSDFYRQQIYDRVKVCRDWLWKFDEKYQILNQSVHENINSL